MSSSIPRRFGQGKTARWDGAARRRMLLGVVTVLVLAACGGSTGNEDGGSGITPQDPQLVSQGADLFEANCARCHGSDVRGTELGPSLLSEVYEPNHHADAAFLIAVQRGSPAHHWRFGAMLPVEGLTPDDVSAIVAFVRETQRTEGFEPYRP